MAQRNLCSYHGSARGCRYGNHCRNSHANPTSILLCRYFVHNHCKYGNNCRFRHTPNNKKASFISKRIYENNKENINSVDSLTNSFNNFNFTIKRKEDASHSADTKNKRFDINKLALISKPHRSRLILSFPFNTGYSNNIFYNQLSSKNRREVNHILFQLYDKYKPARIDTNCGDRTTDIFHCKLIYDNHDSWKKLLQSLPEHSQIIARYITHYETFAAQYIQSDRQKELKYYRNDLQFYLDYFIQNKNAWYPKISVFDTIMAIEEKLKNWNVEFDIDDKTVLYDDYDTEEKKDVFKMIKHSEKINKMIDDILNGIDLLMMRIKEENKSENEMGEWFKMNLKTYENKRNTVVIRVEIHIPIINYLYFIFICKQQWLKLDTNEVLFQRWFDKYCENINGYNNKENMNDTRCYCKNDKIFSIKDLGLDL